jgi:hypothetical protein
VTAFFLVGDLKVIDVEILTRVEIAMEPSSAHSMLSCSWLDVGYRNTSKFGIVVGRIFSTGALSWLENKPPHETPEWRAERKKRGPNQHTVMRNYGREYIFRFHIFSKGKIRAIGMLLQNWLLLQ